MAKKKRGKKSKTSKKKSKKNSDLVIHFMPFSEIASEDTTNRIRKIMGFILDGKLIILQGRLRPEEETKLIENTMTLVGNLKGFQGIELAVVSSDSEHRTVFEKVRHNIARILVGEQDALTIIGPAALVKEIKRNPKKIELMLKRR